MNKKYKSYRFLLLINFILFVFILSGYTQTSHIAFSDSAIAPIILSDTTDEYDISKQIVFLADTEGKWTIKDISTEGFAEKFRTYPLDSTGKINDTDSELTKISSRIYWVRFTIDKTFSTRDYLLNMSYDTIILFIPDAQSNFLIKKSGKKFRFGDRDIQLRHYTLIDIPIYQNIQTFYVQIKNEEPVPPTINIYLKNKNNVLREERIASLFQALLTGIFLALAFYNLMLFFTLKDISYLYYVLYVLCFGLFWIAVNGYGFEFFYPNHPERNRKEFQLLGLSFMFFYILFGKSFLNIKRYLPGWNKALIIFLTVFPIIILFTVVLSKNSPAYVWIDRLMVIWVILSFVIVIIPAVLCLKMGYAPARYFLVANLLLVAGLIIDITSTNWITGLIQQSMQIAASLEVIVFSLGLGNRFNVLHEEKEKAQEKALEVLEEKVHERTIEVIKQKNEIAEQMMKVEEHRKEIIDSITYAKRLQQAILPPLELIKKHLPNSFVLYKPKDIVAGDFYWKEVIDNIIFIAVADCTGHGVPGAMVSVVCSNALNRSVKEFALRDSGKILDKVNDLVLETFEKSGDQINDGMDISFLSYNKTSKQIQWSGANNPLWYITPTGGKLIEVKADKQPIGKFHVRKPFTTNTIEYSENTIFYLFTDGFADQFGGPKGKKFMYNRFGNNLENICKQPLDEQQGILEKAFAEWKGTLEQVDDVTVIGIKI